MAGIYVLLILLRCYLTRAQSLSAFPEQVFDDGLFLKLAESIAAGDWLGAYDRTTLVKGCFFPLFMAISHILHVPLLLGRDLLYALACGLTVTALSPLVANRWKRLAIFAVLLFNPISFSIDRVLREQIYFALTLVVVACGLGMWLRLDKGLRVLLPWSTGLGVALGGFWLTREEGVWILPVLALLYIAGVRQCLCERRDWRRTASALAIPLLLWGACLAAISTLNYAYYAIFATVETKESNFVAAYGALSRIRHRVWLPMVPLPTEARLQAYRYSPAFAELRPYIEGEMGRSFAKEGDPVGWTPIFIGPAYNPVWRDRFNSYFGIEFPQNGADAMEFVREKFRSDPEFADKLQIAVGGYSETRDWLDTNAQISELKGGWFIWAFREAAFLAGHYHDGGEASRFYRRIADEVNSACALKLLDCLPERNTLTPPWDMAYWNPLWQRVYTAMEFLISMAGARVYAAPSDGRAGSLQLVARFTGEKVYSAENQLEGWAWSSSDVLTYEVRDQSGRSWTSKVISGQPSDDVYQDFLKRGIDSASARTARFRINTRCITRCVLVVMGSGRTLGEVPLAKAPVSLHDRSDFRMTIDISQLDYGAPEDVQRNWRKLAVLDFIYRAYLFLFPWLCKISLLAYLALTLLAVRAPALRRVWLASSVLLALVASRVFILSLISVSAFASVSVIYFSPMYPLMILFTALTLAWVTDRSMWIAASGGMRAK